VISVPRPAYRRVLALDPDRDEIRARLLDASCRCATGRTTTLSSRTDAPTRPGDRRRWARLDVFNLLALPIDNARLFAAAQAKAAPWRRGRQPAALCAGCRGSGVRTLKLGFTLAYTISTACRWC